MFDNVKKKILLVGASQMAVDYLKVLDALNTETVIIGRGETSALNFFEKTGKQVIKGGLENYLNSDFENNYDAAILAVGLEELALSATQLMMHGFKKILVEKPAAMSQTEIKNISELCKDVDSKIFVAYNRRFYSSVQKAIEIIKEDGGVSSFNFEFTEWSHTIEPLEKKAGIKENWLIGNSSHVIDLAFFLGGSPKELKSFASGELSWHDKSIFSGAGVSQTGSLFSYQANWEAPGRWAVEILTKSSRLIFKPLEELHIQKKGSVAIIKVEIDDELDKKFKPGLYLQTLNFILGNYSQFKTIQEQEKMFEVFLKIAKGN